MAIDKADETLPYGLAVEKFLLILDEIKKRPSTTEGELSLRMGGAFSKSRHAAIELNAIIIENDKPSLTPIGKNIAWETDDKIKQKKVFSEIIQKYKPYDIAFERMMKVGKDVIPSDFVQQIWAREMNFKLGEENLSKATSFFFQLLEFSGIGKMFLGRKGKSTRFQINSDAKNIIEIYRNKGDLGNIGTEKSSNGQNSEVIGKSTESNGELVDKEKVLIKKQDLSFSPEPEWSILNTDFFILKIRKNSDAWDLLLTMIPIYRKSLNLMTDDKEKSPLENLAEVSKKI
jgi:hypothetical protein